MIPGGEIFQALEKGAIDATEYSMPAVDQMLGFDKVAKYNYCPGWHQTFTAAHLVVNVIRNLAKGEAIQGRGACGGKRCSHLSGRRTVYCPTAPRPGADFHMA